MNQPSISVPVQGLLPQAAGKPQTLGSGAKDFQLARNSGSSRRGCFDGYGTHKEMKKQIPIFFFCIACCIGLYIYKLNPISSPI